MEQLAAFLDGAATTGDSKALWSHLDRCSACQALLTHLAPDGGPTPFGGRYVLERLIGIGGMGVVYRAWDAELMRPVAIKRTQAPADAMAVHEARSIAAVRHDNVVSVFDAGIRDGSAYIVMELVAGPSLREALDDRELNFERREALCLDAGRGLAEIHRTGIVHGDVKPANLLLTREGTIKVVDFGLARSHDARAPGSGCGTPGYLAPEVLAGRAPDVRNDQFAFCVSVYEVLTGTRLGPPPAMGVADLTALPRRIRRVIARGLAPDPADRWPSLDALLSAWEHSRRRRGRWLAGTAVLAASVGLALGIAAPTSRSHDVVPPDPGPTRARPQGTLWERSRELEPAYAALPDRLYPQAAAAARPVFIAATTERNEPLATEAAILWGQGLAPDQPEEAYELLSAAYFWATDSRPDLAFAAARQLALATRHYPTAGRGEAESLWWLRHAEAALERSDGSAAARADLELTRAAVLEGQGDVEGALSAMPRLIEQLNELGDADRAFDAYTLLARFSCRLLDPDCAKHYRSAIERAPSVWHDKPNRRAALLVEAALGTSPFVDAETRLGWAVRAQELADTLPSPVAEQRSVTVAFVLGDIYSRLGKPDEAERVIQEALRYGAALRPQQHATLWTRWAWLAFERGRFEESIERARRALTLHDSERAHPSLSAGPAWCQILALMALHRYDEADAILRTRLADAAVPGRVMQVEIGFADVLVQLGLRRPEQARSRLRRIESMVGSNRPGDMEKDFAYARKLLELVEGGPRRTLMNELEQMLKTDTDRLRSANIRALVSWLSSG